eukprot:655499-Pyramimonas_sp.AAC.1
MTNPVTEPAPQSDSWQRFLSYQAHNAANPRAGAGGGTGRGPGTKRATAVEMALSELEGRRAELAKERRSTSAGASTYKFDRMIPKVRRDWPPLRVYAPSPRTIGLRS